MSEGNGKVAEPTVGDQYGGDNGPDAKGTPPSGSGARRPLTAAPPAGPQGVRGVKAGAINKAKPSPGATESRRDGDEPTQCAEDGPEAALARLRRRHGQVGPPRIDWPVQAERSGERRNFKQTWAVEFLASGMSVTEVAEKVGTDRSTVHRWFNDPIFMGELESRRDEIVESMLDWHILSCRTATAKLIDLVESSDPAIALRAAITLYNGGLRAYHFMDLRKRIDRLEDNL